MSKNNNNSDTTSQKILNETIILSNGTEQLGLYDFLIWELSGGKGTYEADLTAGETPWEDLSMEDKLAWMVNSIVGDVVTDGWHIERKITE